MDILLNNQGDLAVSHQGDILFGESVAQKISIRLKWFAGEWRWNREEGLPYMENLLIKNPDTDYVEALIRGKIFEVEEVTGVNDVSITYDNKMRRAVIRYTAVTDRETIKGEVELSCQNTE